MTRRQRREKTKRIKACPKIWRCAITANGKAEFKRVRLKYRLPPHIDNGWTRIVKEVCE